MTNLEKLDELALAASGVITSEIAIMIARETIKLARANALELDRYLKIICEERIETAKLRLWLREAIRHWVIRTPDVEEAVLAWKMAKAAGV